LKLPRVILLNVMAQVTHNPNYVPPAPPAPPPTTPDRYALLRKLALYFRALGVLLFALTSLAGGVAIAVVVAPLRGVNDPEVTSLALLWTLLVMAGTFIGIFFAAFSNLLSALIPLAIRADEQRI
jgi:hypothetical protein